MGYTKTQHINTNTTPKRVNLTPIITTNTITIINEDSDKYAKSKQVELLAGKLVGLLNNPDSFHFYCKLGWKLPENIIWNNYETAVASKGGDPRKLFTWLCKRDMYNA